MLVLLVQVPVARAAEPGAAPVAAQDVLDVLVNHLDVRVQLVGAAEAAAAHRAAVRFLLVGRVDGRHVVVEPRLAGEGLAAVVARQPHLVHVNLEW